MTWTVKGVPTDVGPGEALLIPRGAVHHFDNTRDIDAKALAIVTPGILGPDFFRELAAILDAAGGGPPDLAAIAAVMGRHGLACTLTATCKTSRRGSQRHSSRNSRVAIAPDCAQGIGRSPSRTPPRVGVDWGCHVELVRLLGGPIRGVVEWRHC